MSAKSAATYSIGTSTINMNSGPAGWTGVIPGDTFGTYPYTVTNTVVPVGGVCTGVMFTPALTTALTSGSALTLTRNTDTPVRALDRQVDVSFINNTVISV